MSSVSIPAISVIIPVYKVEKYISKCLDSIINQALKNFELILIDDGSPDKSGEICDEYAKADNRIKVIHTKNEGVSIARNIGIEMANSNLICFVDSDDWVEEDYLSEFLKLDSEGGMVFQGILYDYEEKQSDNVPFFEYDKVSFPITNQKEIVRYDVLGNGCPCGKLFRKDIIKKFDLKFNKRISTNEDHLFVWQYIQHIEYIILSDRISYHYMKRGGNETLSSKYHPTEEYILVSKLLINELVKIKESFLIDDKNYLKKIFSTFGIEQSFMALFNINKKNYDLAVKSTLKHLKYIKEYYVPSCNIFKILKFCIEKNFPSIAIFMIVKINRIYNMTKNTHRI